MASAQPASVGPASLNGPFAIGLDLGATKIASVLISRAGVVLAARQTATLAAEGAEAVLDRMAAEINALAAAAPGPVDGVGMGSPGQVSPADGVVRYATNLGWDEVHVRDDVRARLAIDLPLWIEKDTNASAVGEHVLGAAAGCRDFVYLAVGSGLGAGIFANGALITGAQNNAAELGHLSLDPNGRQCSCGMRGCAETVVSGSGLVAVTRRRLAEGNPPSALSGSVTLTPAVILDAARSGDPVARAAVAEVAAWLGIVLAACVALLNPAQIVVGGGLGLAAYDLLVPGAWTELQRRVPANIHQPLRVSRSGLSNSALGAACLVWSGMGVVASVERRSHDTSLNAIMPK